MSLIEAAACGRAIVTTNTPGCREIVKDKNNGILVEPRDPVQLADAIEKLLRNADMRQKMGINGRTLVESMFTEERVIAETFDVYRELIGVSEKT